MGAALIKLLLIAAISWGQGAFSPKDESGYFVTNEFCGINNTDAAASIPDCAAQDSLDFESDRGGTALRKRRGFARQGSLPISTGVVNGAHRFITDAGNDIVIACGDTACARSVNRGAFSIFLGTATSGVRFWSIVSVDGDAYGANSKRDRVFVYDGTTQYGSGTIPQGKLLALLPDRLVVANTASAPNRVAYSKSGDFDEFTTGPESVDSFFDDLGSAGDEITYIGSWLGDLLVGKSKSLMLCEVGDQYTTKCSVLTETFGVSDPGAIVQAGEDLYIAASDGTYWKVSRRTGMRPISMNIEGFIDAKAQGSIRSNTQTSQTDWEGGEDSPDGSFSTTISVGDISNSSVTLVDTSSTNFITGTFNQITSSDTYGQINITSSTFVDYFGNRNFTTGPVWTDTSGNFSAASGELFDSVGGGTIYTSQTISTGSFKFKTRAFPTSGFQTITKFISNGATLASPGYALGVEHGSGNTVNIFVYEYPGPSTLASTSITPTNGADSLNTYEITRDASSRFTVFEGSASQNRIIDAFTDSTYNTSTHLVAHCASGNCGWDDFYFLTYRSSGVFTSRIHDTGFLSPIGGVFSVSSSVPVGSTLAHEIRSGNSSDGSDFGSFVSVTNEGHISEVKRYWQYKSTFTTSYTTETPKIMDVSMSAASTGTYRVSCIEPGSGITAFGSLSCSEVNTGNGDFVFYTTSAISCAALPSTTPNNWDAHTNNATVSSPANAAIYYGWRSLLGSATDQAKIESCQLYWTEGTAAQPTWSIYDPVENSIFWTAQTSAATTANRLLKYDIDLSNGVDVFWPLSISAGPLLYYDNHIHFGSSGGGYWNKYAQSGVRSDNGTAISASWKSKDLSFGKPFQEKDFKKLSVTAENSMSGTLGATWATERYTGESFNISLSTSSAYPYIRSNYNLAQKSPAVFFNLQFTNSESDAEVSVLGWGVDFISRSWRTMVP